MFSVAYQVVQEPENVFGNLRDLLADSNVIFFFAVCLDVARLRSELQSTQSLLSDKGIDKLA
jgi:hypothetical protein